MPVAEAKPKTSCFTLKGGLYPLTLLELTHFNLEDLRRDLRIKVAQAPDFFKQVPVILGIEHYQGNQGGIDLTELRTICLSFGLVIVALRGGDEPIQQAASQLGLGLIALPRKKSVPTEVGNAAEKKAPEKSAPGINAETNVQLLSAGSVGAGPVNKVVTMPIRSGQQVYAPGGDLIVLAPVSAGAEILADGNIHVYGPVRGRILAGVNGDKTARVFCQSLEAELISIAGHFTTDEDAQSQYWKKAVHITLAGETLQIQPLFTQTR
jgi:septum site-determining protein MinC